MFGTEKFVRDRILTWNRGKIFFIQDFIDLGSQGSLRIALCNLVSDKLIYRLARGIYCLPRILNGQIWASRYGDKCFNEEVLNGQIVLPSDESIAYALAYKEKVRIMPYGDIAAYRLGLSGMKISSNIYLSDGPPRRIKLYNGHQIVFNHTSEVKIFGFRNETMMLMSNTIRYLGQEQLGKYQMNILRQQIRKVPETDFSVDIEIPPVWVQEILLELWHK